MAVGTGSFVWGDSHNLQTLYAKLHRHYWHTLGGFSFELVIWATNAARKVYLKFRECWISGTTEGILTDTLPCSISEALCPMNRLLFKAVLQWRCSNFREVSLYLHIIIHKDFINWEKCISFTEVQWSNLHKGQGSGKLMVVSYKKHPCHLFQVLHVGSLTHETNNFVSLSYIFV